MGKIKKTESVKLFCGFIYREENINFQVEKVLCENYGETEYRAGPFPFTFTDYYEKEMGKGLKRKFMAFKKVVSPERLYQVKIFTNQLESKFTTSKGQRKINIDPGYITLSKVVLFSTKDFYHRMYLGEGIYGEVTMSYTKGAFSFFPWTFPDYQTEEYLEFFRKLRKKHKRHKDSVKRNEI
jgi:hypothetical protein